MELAQEALKSIISSGDSLKTLVIRLIDGNGKSLDREFARVLNDFDSNFSRFKSVLPNAKQQIQKQAIMLSSSVIDTFGKRKSRIITRYSNEIFQINDKYRTIKDRIIKQMTDKCGEIYDLEQELRKTIQDKENERNKKIEEMNKEADAIVQELQEREKLENEYNEKTAESLKQIEKNYEAIEAQRNAQKKGNEKAINGVVDEISSKSLFFITAEKEADDKHMKSIQRIENEKNSEIDEIIEEQNNIKSLIQKEKDKIKVIAERLKIIENIFARRSNEITTSLTANSHQHNKSLNMSINSTREKIKAIEEECIKSKSEYDQKVAAAMQSSEKYVQEELKKRDGAINEAREKREKEYAKQIENLQIKIAILKEEVEKNTKEAASIVYSVQSDMSKRKNELLDANNKEREDLENEVTKIMMFKEKLRGETDTLKTSTDEIFFSSANNLKHELIAQENRHREEIEKLLSNKPEENFEDFDSYLAEEVKKILEEYMNEEELLEHERSVTLGMKGEEEKSKGYLATKKQNAPEIQALKETEAEMKNRLKVLKQRSATDGLAAEDSYKNGVSRLQEEHNKILTTIAHEHNQKVILLTTEKNKQKQKASENRVKLEEAKKTNAELMERAKLADEMNAKMPLQLKEKARKNRENILEELRNKNFDLMRETRKLTSLKETVLSKIDEYQNKTNRTRKKLDDLIVEFDKTLKEKQEKQEDDYSTSIKEQQQTYEKIFQQMEENQKSISADIIERTNMMLKMIENENKDIDTYQKETDELIEKKKNEMLNDHMKVVNEIKKKNDDERKQLQIEIDNEAFEMKKESCWKDQDNRMDLTRKFEAMQKDLQAKQNRVDELLDKVDLLQEKLNEMNSMPCKTCPKLDDDIDFIKHDMIDIVSKMQSIEAEDANRNYIATHFGTQAKTLPPLKTKELSEQSKESITSDKSKEKITEKAKENNDTTKDDEKKVQARSLKKKEKNTVILKSTKPKPKKLIRKKREKGEDTKE